MFIVKIALMGLVVGTLLVHHFFIILFTKNGAQQSVILAKSLSRYCRISLKVLRINVETNITAVDAKSSLIVSNHLSYTDVLCLSSIYPTLYVTSHEVRETPGLGLICRLSGCLFTERRKSKRKADTIAREIKEIGDCLKAGLSVTIFPEGTTTNGQTMLPFKTPLLQSAIENKTPIFPLCLKYERPDIVAWYGDMTFLPHMVQLSKAGSQKMKILKAQKINPEEFPTRQDLGLKAQEVVGELFSETCNF